MKIVFILSAIFLLLGIIWIGVYVIVKKTHNYEIDRITLIVSIIGILISSCFSICSMPSAFETTDEVMSSYEYSQEYKTESKDNYYESKTDDVIEDADNSLTEYVKNNSSYTETSTTNTSTEQPNSSTDNFSESMFSTEESQDNKSKIVPLYETKTYLQNGSITREDITSDPRGNTYNNAYVFWGQYSTLNTGGEHYDKPYIEKYLGGNYNEFSAKLIPYEDFDKFNKNVQAEIRVYADEKLVYTSNRITRKTDCEEIIISVENVNYLKIELNAGTQLTSYHNKYSVIMHDAKLITK